MPDENELSTLLVVVISTLFKMSALSALSSKYFAKRRQRECAGRLTRLTVYPVKSMKGIDIASAECDHSGLIGHVNGGLIRDRAWMLVTEGKNCMTARQRPKMVLITPSLHGNALHLDGPGLETVKLSALMKKTDGKLVEAKVFGESVEGVDCGDDVANVLSSYLGVTALRVLYHADGSKRRQIQDGGQKWHKTASNGDKAIFQDGFPFLLICENSVADLSKRIESGNISTRNFRPNFVVTADLPPFDEDDWLEVFIGDAIFRNIKPCDRCQLTTVDPDTGVMHPNKEPLTTLRSYRLTEPELAPSPIMGINLVLVQPGTIRAGDSVYVTRKVKD